MQDRHWASARQGSTITTAKMPGSRERQAEVFRKVIDLAKSLNLPLIIHSRDAEQPALEMVKHLDKVIFHCYSGTLVTMKEAVDRGFYISLATNICRSSHHQILAGMYHWTISWWKPTALS